jgi:hypothetical protein
MPATTARYTRSADADQRKGGGAGPDGHVSQIGDPAAGGVAGPRGALEGWVSAGWTETNEPWLFRSKGRAAAGPATPSAMATETMPATRRVAAEQIM